ncbi:polymorphic toxin-type HINT domain-containing protein [Streptomyces sp. NPDC048018]|uniref:polymorphic toxin-type HINT domain-containing protein n=1 Tax=Streptomyces sp. NPDC048018 TaxID=3365499 RepID=UPI0037116F0C
MATLLPASAWAIPPGSARDGIDLVDLQPSELAPPDEAKIDELSSWSGKPVEPPAEYTPDNTIPATPGTKPVSLDQAGDELVQAGDLPVKLGQASPTASEPTPPAPTGTWSVTVADRSTTETAEVDGALIKVTPPSTGATPVDVELDYSKFEDLYGTEWSSRLKFVQLPECFLTTPDAPECSKATAVPTVNDPAGETVRATIDPATAQTQGLSAQAGGGPVVLAATDSAAGAGGTFKATSLSPSGSWSAGGSSGGFSWTYPLAVPAPPAGPAPKVAFSYSSQSVDGKTSVANSQASWIGDGWDYHPGFIERRYRSCSDDTKDGANNAGDADKKKSDLCWASDNLVLSLGGSTTELVLEDNKWVPANDDGAEVEYLDKQGNDRVKQDTKYDGEFWKVTTRDGTRYYFGRNDVDGTGTRPVTNSAFTAPVFGNHSGEPCHQATYPASSCTQAWRWNLDYVEDVHGNAMIIDWKQEANEYAKNEAYEAPVSYVRGGYPTQILYGLHSDNLSGPPAGRVEFKVDQRCIKEGSVTCSDTEFESENYADKQSWWDTPSTLHCKVDAKKCFVSAPTFWTRMRLAAVNTYGQRTPGSTTLSLVDAWNLKQSFPRQRTDTHPPLWLESITRTGYGTDKDAAGKQVSTAMPSVSFIANVVDMPNRVATSTTDATPDFDRLRVETIRTETGGEIYVDYSAPCPVGGTHPAPESNTTRCFPSKWSVDPDVENPKVEWFNKYVVEQVLEKDRATRQPDVVTTYLYDTAKGAAWAKNTDEFTKPELRTYDQWRGYDQVTVRKGITSAADPNTATEQSQTTSRFFRGMSKDAGRAAITVKDSTGTETMGEDLPAYQGQAYETITYTKAGGSIATRQLTWPFATTTATRTREGLPPLEAYRTGTLRTDAIESISGGKVRTKRTETLTRDGYDLPLTTHTYTLAPNEQGTAVTGDESCTTTSYVHNTNINLIGLPQRIRTTVGTCAQAAAATGTQIISDTRTSYDALAAFGTAPSKGLARQVDSINGDGTGWITSARTDYDALGRVTKVLDAKSNPSTTSYSPATGVPFAITTTNALGHTTTTAYDPGRGTPLSVVDANGRKTTGRYDPLGRLIDVWSPSRNQATDKASTHYEYQIDADKVPAVTARTLRDNGTYEDSVTIYDGLLRPRQTQTEALSGGRIITDTLYNASGTVSETKNAYFAKDEPKAETYAPLSDYEVPNSTKTAYDGLGRAVRTTTLSKGTAKYSSTAQYAGDWTLARTGMSPGGTTPLQGSRSLKTWTDALGRTERIQHYTTTDLTGPAPASLETRYSYDPKGKVAQVTDPQNNTWTYTYDVRGRLKESKDPDIGTASFGYNDLDQQTWSRDSLLRTQHTLYDALGRKTELHDDSDTGPLVAKWTYDTLSGGKGYPVASTRYYDGAAFTSEVTGYDTEARPTGTKITIPEITGTTSLAGITKGLAGTYIYSTTYTATGKPQSVTLPATPGGLATEKVITRYSGEGAPITTSGLAWYTSGTIYSPHGEVLRTTTGDASRRIWTTTAYDEFTGWLKQTVAQRETTSPIWSSALNYQYDTVGNITSITGSQSENNGTQTTTKTDRQCFTYDPMGQLIHAWTGTQGCPTTAVAGDGGVHGPTQSQVTAGDDSNGYWQSYQFDAIGNRTKLTVHDPTGVNTNEEYQYTYGKTVQGNQTQPPATSQPHTLASIASRQDIAGSTFALRQSYQHDTTGNTTSRLTAGGDTTSFAWDRRNKLTSANTNNDGTPEVTYLYDASGNRLVEDNGTTRTLYLGETEITANTAGQAVDARRAYSHPGAPTTLRTTAGKTTGHKLTVLRTDQHNTSTTAIDQTASQAVTRRFFDPYGNPRGTKPTNWPDRHTFLGTGVDDPTTGLTHIGAREYDATTGRFISADPIIDITDPLQMNGYTYANGNPITNSDPTGLKLDDGSGGKGETFYQDADWGTWDGTQADATRQAYAAAVVMDSRPPSNSKWLRNPDTVGAAEVHRMIAKYDPHGNVTDQVSFKMWAAGASDEEIEYFRSHLCDVITCYKDPLEAGLAGKHIDSEIYDKPTSQAFGEALASGLASRVGAGAKGRPGALCGRNSFAPGTQILLADGSTKPIENVEAGDMVIATNPETGETKPKQVTATIFTQADKTFVDLTITTGDGSRTITATEHHPFWSESEQKWLDAGDLAPGMTLLTERGTSATVQRTRTYTAAQDTYNLTIADLHTYYVLAGATPVLVHNSNCPIGSVTGPAGEVLPLPKGAAGTPVDTGKGWAYDIPAGTKGLDPRVVQVRVMDPVTTGKYQYLNGYVVYMNKAGQSVNPLTGQTVSRADPYNHIRIP